MNSNDQVAKLTELVAKLVDSHASQTLLLRGNLSRLIDRVTAL